MQIVHQAEDRFATQHLRSALAHAGLQVCNAEGGLLGGTGAWCACNWRVAGEPFNCIRVPALRAWDAAAVAGAASGAPLPLRVSSALV